jgi:multidrug efflux pump subunit AcrB
MSALLLLALACGPSEPPPVAEVFVSVDVPGAQPDAVWSGVGRPLEEAIRERPDVAHVVATSNEGHAMLQATFVPEYPEDWTETPVERIRSIVDPMGEMLPRGVLQPVVGESVDRTPWLLPSPARADEVKGLLARVGVSDVRVDGLSDGIEIQVDPTRLAAFGLPVETVARRLRVVEPDGLLLSSEPPSLEALRAIGLVEGVQVRDVATLERAEPAVRVHTGSDEPAAMFWVSRPIPDETAREAGLVRLQFGVGLRGPGVDAAVNATAGRTAVARSEQRTTVYFTDAATRDAALSTWAVQPGVVALPERAHDQVLYVVSKDGQPVRVDGLPVVPLDPQPEPELQMTIDRDRVRALRISTEEVAAQLKAAVEGKALSPSVRMRVGDADDPVQLASSPLRLRDGTAVPMGQVVTLTQAVGPGPLHHWNGLRVVPYVVTASESLEAAEVQAVFDANGVKAPFWLGRR